MQPTGGFTNYHGHGYEVGDVLDLNTGGGRWSRLRRLLVRPRVFFVEECTSTTFSIGERRMTWAEWRGAMWRAIKG